MKPSVELLLNMYSKLQGDRGVWTNMWQDIRDLVRPNASDFYDQATNPGQVRTEKMYDGTPAWALQMLASALNSFLTSPIERWFNFTLEGNTKFLDSGSRLWLETVADITYSEYSRPVVAYNSSVHECYMDVAGFGTSIFYQTYDPMEGHLVFKTVPLADCYLLENANGHVDGIFRKLGMTKRQLIGRFTEATLPKKILDDKDMNKRYEVIHIVLPRDDRDIQKITKTNMAFASYWICKDTGDMLDESGFMEFPYHVPRWEKVAGETYGRSPAMTCMPDIKMLNQMSKVVIKAAQKVIDPPLMVPDDGFLLPIKTSPGSLMFYTSGSQDRVEPLKTGGDIEIGLEMMNQRREHIIKCFYVDWLLMQKENIEMTATEVLDRRQEKMQLMAPMIGRLQTELLGPQLARSYNLLTRAGKIPPPPRRLSGAKMKLEYVSPAVKAQYGTKMTQLNQFTQALIPISQLDPTVMDIVNTDAMAEEMADITNVSRKILRTPDEITARRESRQQQQNAVTQGAMAKNSADIVKTLADAQSQGG